MRDIDPETMAALERIVAMLADLPPEAQEIVLRLAENLAADPLYQREAAKR